MGDGVEFARDEVGVLAKSGWRDAERFAGVAHAIRQDMYGVGAVKDLPEGSNEGTSALRDALSYARSTMTDVVNEFSDACGVLGSGSEETISNFDESEYAMSESFAAIHARLEGNA